MLDIENVNDDREDYCLLFDSKKICVSLMGHRSKKRDYGNRNTVGKTQSVPIPPKSGYTPVGPLDRRSHQYVAADLRFSRR
jgi:hypothetical protein